MNRDQLAEILRAASLVASEPPVVMGSQAILGTYDAAQLPPEATVSMEADVAFLNDPDRLKADLVTGAIGEDSNFHQLRGYYAEGIDVSTAKLPDGWRDRLITLAIPAGSTGPATSASFLERHDLVVAKVAAFREKDIRFVTELVKANLVDPEIARARLGQTDLHPIALQRAAGLLDQLAHGGRTRPGPATSVAQVGEQIDDAAAARLRRNPQRSHGEHGPGPGFGGPAR